MASFAIPLVFVAEQADGVNHDVGLLNFANSLLKRIAAGVVFAVGDGEQNFLFLVALLGVIHGADERVVESRAAAGIDSFERFLEFRNAVGEILVEVEIVVVVEIDDEGFVLGIAGLDESERGFVYASTLVAHAAAVINDQTHADGNVFALEDGKFLFGFVFEDAEIFLL